MSQYPKRFLKATIISNIFTLGVNAVYLKTILRYSVIVVLLNYALSSISELKIGIVIPPVLIIAVLVKLTTTIIKSMGNFVTNYEANGTKV